MQLPEASQTSPVVVRWVHGFLFVGSQRSVTHTEDQQQQQGHTHGDTHQTGEDVLNTLMSSAECLLFFCELHCRLCLTHFLLLSPPLTDTVRYSSELHLYHISDPHTRVPLWGNNPLHVLTNTTSLQSQSAVYAPVYSLTSAIKGGRGDQSRMVLQFSACVLQHVFMSSNQSCDGRETCKLSVQYHNQQIRAPLSW